MDDSRLSRHVPDGKLDVGVGKPVEIGRPQPGAMLYEHAQRAQRWGHRETERAPDPVAATSASSHVMWGKDTHGTPGLDRQAEEVGTWGNTGGNARPQMPSLP